MIMNQTVKHEKVLQRNERISMDIPISSGRKKKESERRTRGAAKGFQKRSVRRMLLDLRSGESLSSISQQNLRLEILIIYIKYAINIFSII